MCGLVGVITKLSNGFSYEQVSVFEELLHIDTLRGDDSTGVFLVNGIGNVGIAKDIGTGWRFTKSKEWNELRNHALSQGRALIGHNRKATRGTVTDTNAHPFWVEDKLVLVHNGSYIGSHKHLKDVEVDSLAIAHHLADNLDDVEQALQKVNAAYALIWYNVANKSVNFIRNPERPLAWVETKDAWYYASESKMLQFVLERNNITHEKIYTFPDYNLNTWTLTSKSPTGWEVTGEKLDCKYKGSPVYHMTPHRNFAQAYGEWEQEVNDSCTFVADLVKEEQTKESPPLKLVETNPPPKQETVITVMPWMRKVTLREYQELVKAYPADTKVKVIIDDFYDTDGNSSVVDVSGKVLDSNSIPVLFKLSRGTLNTITDPENMNNAVFEVTVSGSKWSKTDKRAHRNIDDAEGLMLILGKEPTIVFDGNGVGHA
jgi:hypothetical protein